MFSIIATWPLWAQILSGFAILATCIIISIYGQAAIGWGKTKIGLGGAKSKIKYKQKRDCMDCLTILRGKAAKINRKIHSIENKILKDKMNHAEQKIVTIQRMIFTKYSKAVRDKDIGSEDRESKECNLYHARMVIALGIIKDELRRSFKENGFHELSETELNVYIKDQTKMILGIYNEYMLANYPRQMVVSAEEAQEVIDDLAAEIREILDDLYRKAREIELDYNKDILQLEQVYEQDVDEFGGVA